MRRLLYIFLSCFIFSNAFAGNYHWPSSSNGDSLNKGDELPISTSTCTPNADPDTLICTIGVNTLTLIITGTNLLCNNDFSGSASVSVSGGVLPYTYDWSPSGQTTATATGFSAGVKSVEVWDNTGVSSCIISITLCEPSPLFVSIVPPAPQTSCFGICDGSATANPGGTATPPYSYSWSNGDTTALADSLCGGTTYSVTVTDANGCTKIKTITIGQPPILSPNGTSTNITCFGLCNGSACVAPSGGTLPYTYSWSTGATTSCVSSLCATPVLTCTVTDANGCVNVYSTSITQPPALTVTVTGTNLLCNAVCTGSITATASGGVAPYTYSWAPGGCVNDTCINLCAGAYTLTLTDANGCTATSTVTLTEPPALATTPASANIDCFGNCNGSVSVNPSGGTAPYTYAWLPGGCTTDTCSSLCAGTYTATVTDANGCTATATATVTEPPLLTLSISSTDVICPGACNGTASVTVTGGTPSYTYAWSPGGFTTSAIAGLCAGNYTVIVTDNNGCDDTAFVTINMPSPLLTNITTTNDSCFAACQGTASSAATGGTPPYTYGWSNGCTTSACTGLCAGNYTLTLMDANGCPSTTTFTITQPGVFTTSIASATPNPLNCNGDCNGTVASSVSGGTPTYTYLWSPGGQTTPSITGLCAGTYNLDVADANGCTASTSVTFLQPTTMTVTITSSNPTCNLSCDGSISAVVGGGTPAYTFLWLPGGQTTSGIGGQCAGTFTLTTTDSKGCSNTQTITLTAPATLAANAAVITNVSCAGNCDGSASASPTGGTSPFTYLWSPGGQTTPTATGLCAGTFSVTVTDASGCVDIDIVTITQPGVLSSSISSTTSSCTLCNGTATVSTSGGTAPYTFLWCDGQTTSTAVGLCIGTCSVTVTDVNGCTNTLTVTINPVVIITVTASGNSVSCNGSCDGIATATPSGGGTPYTYSWSPTAQTTQSATGLCAGIYTVTVADTNGCISSATITLTDPPALGNAMSSTTASCGLCNGTATSTPSGGTGAYTYTWSGFPVQTTATATGLCSGNYTVTVADANNCTITTTVSVGLIPAISTAPSVTLAACGASDGAICAGASGGTAPYTYLWSPGGATTSCITGLAAGIDTVIITDAAGCSDTFAIAVGNISGPTVTTSSLINPLCNGDCNGFISLSASGGTPPYNFLWNPGGQTTTSVAGLCAGVYIIQVTDAVPCTTFVSDTLVDPPQLNSNPSITNVSCNGGNDGSICVSPSGGTSPYTYTWLSIGQTTSCATGLSAGTYTLVLADATGCDDTVLIPVSEPALLSVTISSTNVTCNGACDGTATASVSGGTPLYTYLWSTGAPIPPIVGLCPNTYSITVTDGNGCVATASVTITEPTALTTTLTSTNITCNSLCDGTATITASGGTTAYTYLWNPNGETTPAITGLCTGNYQGTVTDANGCVSTQSVAITQPSALAVTVSTTSVSCNGGSTGTATATVTGGTGAYTYLWNPGGQTTSSVTGLSAGSYTLDVTDANGCISNNFFSISEPLLLMAGITNTSPSCFGGCDGTATSSPVGGTGAYTFLWSNGQTTSTATGLCAGTYTLTLSDANGCVITQTTTVLDPPQLTQANGVAGATCMLCNGSISIVASGGTSPYSFFWSNGQTTATITGLCAGVYIDTVMDANGCISVDTISVSNTSGPALSFTVTNVTCNGLCDGSATVSATGDGPPWIYSWFPTGQTTSTATGLCATPNPPAQYFVTVTDTNGCITVADTNISEPPAIVLTSSVTNATCFSLCDGSITASAAGGTGTLTYLWNTSATTASITSQCAGNYTLTVTDANGCVLTTTFTIGQNSILTTTVTSTNATCNASCDGTASVTVSGGAAPYTYLWSPTGQTTSSATGLCAGTHTITATDGAGCVIIDSTTAIITEPAVLSAGITAVNPLCNNSCDGSLTSSPTGGTPPYTYLWNPGGATTTAITGLCAGNDTLILTDANGCVATTTITLTAPSAITSTDVVVDASCTNLCDGSIDITPVGGTGTYTFLWSNSAATEDVTGLCGGIYSVTITDANGCTFSDSMTVDTITVVISAAGNDTSFCQNGTATLTSSSTNAVSVEWWQITSPSWTFIGTTTTINQNPSVGVTDYALIAINGICKDTDTVSVTVNAFPVLVTSNDTTICSGDSIILCSSNATTYQWYSPLWTPVSTASCITVSPASTTVYAVIGMNGLCPDTDSVSVTVMPMPIANAGSDISFCVGGSTQLCDTLSLNGTTPSTWWQISSPSWTPVDTDSCTMVTPTTSTDYAVIVSNGLCSDTDTVSVIVNQLPVADAGPNVTILSTSSTVLNGTGNGVYVWTPATGLSCTTCANPTANPTVTTTYTLVVTDTATGCMDLDSVRITIVLDVVPNDGLSPNGDGINDVWTIPGIEMFPDALVEVYNRWGELLFSSIGYTTKWDATYNGKELPVGTYYYVINLNSDLIKEPLTGPITILR